MKIENDGRTATLIGDRKDAKTVLGSVGMQSYSAGQNDGTGSTQDEKLIFQTPSSKYYILYHIESIDSTCLCVGV